MFVIVHLVLKYTRISKNTSGGTSQTVFFRGGDGQCQFQTLTIN